MSALLITLRDIALLRTPAYEQFRDRKDAMRPAARPSWSTS